MVEIDVDLALAEVVVLVLAVVLVADVEAVPVVDVVLVPDVVPVVEPGSVVLVTILVGLIATLELEPCGGVVVRFAKNTADATKIAITTTAAATRTLDTPRLPVIMPDVALRQGNIFF